MFYRLLCGCAAIIIFWFLQCRCDFFKNKEMQDDKKQLKLSKTLSVAMYVMAFINVYLPDLWGDRFSDMPELMYNLHDPLFSVARLFAAAMVVTIPIALIYHRKTFSRFVVIFGIPSFLANCLLADKYMYYYQNALSCPFTELSRAFTTNFWFRAIFFAVFELLKLFLVIRTAAKRREDLRFNGIADVGGFLLRSIPLLFVNMPIAFPSQFTGSFCSSITLSSCNWVNLLWMLEIVLEITVLTLMFRKRTYEDRYILLIVLSLSLLLQYSSFMQGSEYTMVVRLPFQLCNFACLFLPIAIITHKRPLLCFASIANVVGAIAAVIICDTPGGDGLFYTLNVHYMIEHTGIITIGFLLMTLGIITPLKKRDLVSIIKIFNVYFFFVLILGTVFNAVDAAHNYEKVIISLDPYVGIDFHCNYLFMFLEDVAVDIVPAFAVLYRTYLPLGSYAKLQLSELVMYFCFTIVCVGPFFIFYAIFKDKKKAEKCGGESLDEHNH